MIDIAYLCPPGESPVRRLSNPYGSSTVVRVRGGDWHAARAQALQQAQGDAMLVLAGHCRPRCVRGGAQAHAEHGLLLYLGRLLGEVCASVYVPPVGALQGLRAGWAELQPGHAMCAAYRPEVALRADPARPGLGLRLAALGCLSVTLSDYVYEQFGPTVLEEAGTRASWRKAHVRAHQEFI